MIEVSVTEAKRQFSRLLTKVAEGEEVIIARRGVVIAKMVAVANPSRKRLLGQERGQVVISEDFDDPVDPLTWR